MNARSLNFFTDEGLLPNYAFPEAGVVLRSVIYRRNSKTEDDERKYKTQTYEYERPAAAAILELAPANHFYAEGRKLEVDQVNLQVSQIEPWRFCSDCSYLGVGGAVGAARLLPRLRVVRSGQMKATPAQHVAYAPSHLDPSEQESRSYDESDDREPQFYQKNMFVVKEDADITKRTSSIAKKCRSASSSSGRLLCGK